jgi:hypothetical protein
MSYIGGGTLDRGKLPLYGSDAPAPSGPIGLVLDGSDPRSVQQFSGVLTIDLKGMDDALDIGDARNEFASLDFRYLGLADSGSIRQTLTGNADSSAQRSQCLGEAQASVVTVSWFEHQRGIDLRWLEKAMVLPMAHCRTHRSRFRNRAGISTATAFRRSGSRSGSSTVGVATAGSKGGGPAGPRGRANPSDPPEVHDADVAMPAGDR